MGTIKTMTLNNLTALLRSYGVKISESILADGIEQGQFPFGDCIKTAKGRRFFIYWELVDKWIQERVRSAVLTALRAQLPTLIFISYQWQLLSEKVSSVE